MSWHIWTIAALALIVAGWMAFDGSRGLFVGDYVTPKTGRHAGQLGPWAGVVRTVGIEPRSNLMKSIFVVYGFAWLVVLVFFVAGLKWAWWGLVLFAVGSLWYLPFGTLCGLIQIGLLLLPVVRVRYGI